MKVDDALVDHVASLAHLSLTDEERNLFKQDFIAVTDAFSVLKEVDTSGTLPTHHPVSNEGLMREDVVVQGVSQEEALQFTKEVEEGYFVGPKAL